MTTPPWTDHDDHQPDPAAGPGYGWRTSTGRERHAADAVDRHDSEPQDRHGAAARPPAARSSGTVERHGGRAGAVPEVVPTHHQIVVPDEDGHAGDRAADADADAAGDGEDAVPPYLLTGGLRRLITELRFINEPLHSLRDLLRLAKKGTYNLSSVAVVRAANIAFFWVVTAPVLTVVLLLLWLFAVSLHRALWVLVIVLAVAIPADTIPVIGWLIPDWLVATSWSATTWQWIGGGVVVFVLATVIALAGERRR